MFSTTTHHRAPMTNESALTELRAMLMARAMPKQYLARCENRGMPSLLVQWQAKNRPRHTAHPGVSRTYCTACGETF